MDGADAPKQWRAGNCQQVMDYCLGDCQMTNLIVRAIADARQVQWVTARGYVSSKPMARLKTVEEVIRAGRLYLTVPGIGRGCLGAFGCTRDDGVEVALADGGDDLVDMVLGRRVVGNTLGVCDAELRRVALAVGSFAAGNQRLGGHAAVVQAVAAHLVFLEEDDGPAKGCRGGGHRKPAGPCADHAKVGFDRLARLRYRQRRVA